MSIVVYQVPGAWGLPSVSPFCTKLQTYLRMRELPYQVQDANMMRAPKGKVPYVSIDGGPLLGDSQLVIQELVRRHGDPLDRHLDARARASGRLVRRTLEEGVYFASVYGRWIDDGGWAVTRQAYRSFIPAFALPFVRLSVHRSSRAQGTGRHEPSEIAAMAIADWDAIATVLGEHTYLFGDRPTSFDATVFAFAWGALAFPHEGCELRAHLKKIPNVVAYVDRMKARYFPEGASDAAAPGGTVSP